MIYFLLTLFFEIFGKIGVPVSNSVFILENENFHESAPIMVEMPVEVVPKKEISEKIKKTEKLVQIEDDILVPESKVVMELASEAVIPFEQIETETVKTELQPILEKKEAPIIFLDTEKLSYKSRNSLSTPKKVKGIYLTGYSFSSFKRRTELIKLVKDTELNTVIIDIQDPYGNFMFPVKNETLKKINLAKISFSREKFRGILDELQKANIYTIARVTTFQDEGSTRAFPYLILKNKLGHNWENYKGINWLDMTNKESWEIPLLKAQEAADIGFDEVQFDYIRFPSDGRISQIKYKDLGRKRKYQVMEEFFEFLSKNKPSIGVPISIDLFGATYSKYKNEEYDLSIGQRVIGAIEYFDYLSPMIYPSHYASGYAGYKNPAKFPYQVVNKAMIDGHDMIETHTQEPVSKSRPWLQAFNLGAKYNYQNIREEIRAVDENNASGWILWNSRNVYGQAF